MMKCTRCGTVGGDGAAYCGNCGAQLTAQASAGAGPAPNISAGASPQPAPKAARPVVTGTSTSFAGAGIGALAVLVGVASFVAFIVLQFIKVSMDGASISAAQANGICQSALGQLGQAFSSGFGNNSPTGFCTKAATIEDWKGVTLWLGIALILFGLGKVGRSARRVPRRTGNLRTSVSSGGSLSNK